MLSVCLPAAIKMSLMSMVRFGSLVRARAMARIASSCRLAAESALAYSAQSRELSGLPQQ